jgi:hypothetical protein
MRPATVDPGDGSLQRETIVELFRQPTVAQLKGELNGPPQETIGITRRAHRRGRLRSVVIAPTLKRPRKRDSMPEETIATARQEPMTPMEETVRDELAARQHVEQVSAGRSMARQHAEARSARQITAIATEAAALLLAPVPE